MRAHVQFLYLFFVNKGVYFGFVVLLRSLRVVCTFLHDLLLDGACLLELEPVGSATDFLPDEVSMFGRLFVGGQADDGVDFKNIDLQHILIYFIFLLCVFI